MTSAPHLLNEDRPDFDRVLDDALHIVLDGADEGSGHPLNAEQLRTLALAACDTIEAAADDEYQEYRTLRADIREAARASARDHANRSFGYAAMGVTDGARRGAGLVAVMAVLTPLLASSAAVIFLLIGYALRAVSPEPAIAAPLRTAGWFFAVVTAAAILIGVIGLLLTALRDGSSAIHDTPESMPDEVARARAAWHDALLTRGLLPFLEDALSAAAAAGAAAGATGAATGTGAGAAAGAAGTGAGAAAGAATGTEAGVAGGATTSAPAGATAGATTGTATSVPAPAGASGSGTSSSRMPRLGYSRPDFSSPQDGPATAPRFSSPDFTSPDFGGPEYGGAEHRPE